MIEKHDYIKNLAETLRSIAFKGNRRFELLPQDRSALVVVKLRTCKASLTEGSMTDEGVVAFTRLGSDGALEMKWHLQTTYSPNRSLRYCTEERGRKYSYPLVAFAQEILQQLESYSALFE